MEGAGTKGEERRPLTTDEEMLTPMPPMTDITEKTETRLVLKLPHSSRSKCVKCMNWTTLTMLMIGICSPIFAVVSTRVFMIWIFVASALLLYLVYHSVATCTNDLVIIADKTKDSLIVTRGKPLWIPYGVAKSFHPLSGIQQIYCVQGAGGIIVVRAATTPRQGYARSETLLNCGDYQIASFIEIQIELFLNIVDRPVQAEIPKSIPLTAAVPTAHLIPAQPTVIELV